MTRILAINGSYRDDGITDQAVVTVVQAAEAVGAGVEEIRLRDYPIEFCLNCRECTWYSAKVILTGSVGLSAFRTRRASQ